MKLMKIFIYIVLVALISILDLSGSDAERSHLLSNGSDDTETLGFIEEIIQSNTYHLAISKKAFGAISSALSSAVFYIVGQRGAELIWGDKIFTNALATASIIPIEAVGMHFISSLFNNLVLFPGEKEKKATIPFCQPKNVPRICTVSICAALSTLPYVYLSYDYFKLHLGMGALIFAIPSAYVKLIVDYLSIDGLRDRIYNVFRAEDPKQKRLKSSLFATNVRIGKMDTAEINLLLDRLRSTTLRTHEKLALLVGSLPSEALPENVTAQRLRTAITISGAIIGAIGMSCMEPLSEKAVISMGITNAAFVRVIAFAATISAASLMAMTSWDVFGLICDAFATNQSKLTLRGSLIGITSIFALMPAAALSVEYLGVHGVFPIIALISNILGTFLLDYWSLTSFLDGIKESSSQRIILSSIINTIASKIPSLKPEAISAMYRILTNMEGVQ